MRKTKIIATLGPASNSLEKISDLIMAGANVFRLNFSHGTQEQHQKTAALVRVAAANLGQEVKILADLQGPKIRIRNFPLVKRLFVMVSRLRCMLIHR